MKKFLLTTVTVLALGATTFTGAASAAPYNDHRPPVVQNNHGYFSMNGHRYERMRGPSWKAPKNYHAQTWRRGERLPADYRRAEIRDWRAYHLTPPPRGYHYVRVGNDVVLTAIATGIISVVIANAFYN